MAWIESHDELPTHPKTLRAARRLKVNAPTIVGHLHFLWYWCLTHAPDGRLEGMDADDVADAAGWEDDGETFVDVLVGAGWLDDDNGTLVVHDWWEGAGKTIKRRKFATERQRKARESQKADAEQDDKSPDSHDDVTRDRGASHGADSDSDSDKDLTPLSTGVDPVEESFEQFWQIYPARAGKKVGKGNALIEWRKLTLEQRRRAYIGAKHLAAAGQMPKDPERFLRRPKGGRGDFPFDDWQAATPEFTDQDRASLIGTGGVA